VPALMTTLKAQLQTYRVKLGILVALSDMVGKDKARSKDMSSYLSDADLELLLALTGDDDKTVRVYATQFLTDLADPRQARLAAQRALSGTDQTTIRNPLLSIQRSIERVSPGERQEIQQSLDSLKGKADPKTRSVIEQLQMVR
jgi:hypothetical protein